MLIVVTEDVPPRLRGRLAVWLLEVRAGVYIGDYGVKVRDSITRQVEAGVGDGNAVVAWTAPNDAGFDFLTFGHNRRNPVDFDGLKLVAFAPKSA